MSYDPTVAAVRQIITGGLYDSLSTAASISHGGQIYSYCSSHSCTQAGGITGFFAGCGAQPTSGPTAGILAKSSNSVGMRFGDLLVNVESSGGASPGRVTWHCVTGSTFNQSSTAGSTTQRSGAGFDVTISLMSPTST